MSASLSTFLQQLRQRDPEQTPFHQAAEEVLQSLWPYIERNPKYQQPGLIERLVEPERVIMFRVAWVDDAGHIQVNRGYRVQMNSAIGPYKGGIRSIKRDTGRAQVSRLRADFQECADLTAHGGR